MAEFADIDNFYLFLFILVKHNENGKRMRREKDENYIL